jgi:hypothetical protein
MTYKLTLREKIADLREKACDFFKAGVKLAFTGYITFSLLSHNGCLDSQRTEQAKSLHNTNNQTKVVTRIGEEWKDNSKYLLAMGGNGYNPRVIRTIIFEDGTQSIVDYRTLAHQPITRWLKGEEFNPQAGEKYEVTKYNELVKRVK